MSNPNQDPNISKITEKVKLLGMSNDKEEEKIKEIILKGVKSIEAVTDLVTQLVYEEEKRRNQFKDILTMIKNLLELSSHRTHSIAKQYGRRYPSLTGSLARMLMELTDLEDLASCKEIDEMKEVIEDLNNW
jgi:hypothetical protein